MAAAELIHAWLESGLIRLQTAETLSVDAIIYAMTHSSYVVLAITRDADGDLVIMFDYDIIFEQAPRYSWRLLPHRNLTMKRFFR